MPTHGVPVAISTINSSWKVFYEVNLCLHEKYEAAVKILMLACASVVAVCSVSLVLAYPARLPLGMHVLRL